MHIDILGGPGWRIAPGQPSIVVQVSLETREMVIRRALSDPIAAPRLRQLARRLEHWHAMPAEVSDDTLVRALVRGCAVLPLAPMKGLSSSAARAIPTASPARPEPDRPAEPSRVARRRSTVAVEVPDIFPLANQSHAADALRRASASGRPFYAECVACRRQRAEAGVPS